MTNAGMMRVRPEAFDLGRSQLELLFPSPEDGLEVAQSLAISALRVGGLLGGEG